MNTMAVKKEIEREIKKIVQKISLHVKSDSAIIYRNDTELPFIIDKTENALKWLVKNGFKQEDIEIVGEKPSTWDSIFSSA